VQKLVVRDAVNKSTKEPTVELTLKAVVKFEFHDEAQGGACCEAISLWWSIAWISQSPSGWGKIKRSDLNYKWWNYEVPKKNQ
jgi:hypothetical protein